MCISGWLSQLSGMYLGLSGIWLSCCRWRMHRCWSLKSMLRSRNPSRCSCSSPRRSRPRLAGEPPAIVFAFILSLIIRHLSYKIMKYHQISAFIQTRQQSFAIYFFCSLLLLFFKIYQNLQLNWLLNLYFYSIYQQNIFFTSKYYLLFLDLICKGWFLWFIFK